MKYQVYKKCKMDTSDPDITFNTKGICCYCKLMQEKERRQVKKCIIGNNIMKNCMIF